MPIIGIIIGGVDFSGLSINIGEANITYGKFIQNVIDFLIISVFIFFFVKFIERFTKKVKEESVETEVVEQKEDETVTLLKEIRDILKNNK